MKKKNQKHTIEDGKLRPRDSIMSNKLKTTIYSLPIISGGNWDLKI